MNPIRHAWPAAVLAGALALHAGPARAVEGGTGGYLLGSRDILSGIVPPPGDYFSGDLVLQQGQVEFVALGGIPFSDVSTDVRILKLNATRSFDASLWGGRPMLTVTLPVANPELTFSGALLNGASGSVRDSVTGIGDITVTPAVGWNQGVHFWQVNATIYLPTGYYEPASVDLATRSVSAASVGKNRAAVDPGAAYTYLNRTNGREFSAAAGVTFSLENAETDYQTAPEAHLEIAAAQHLPNGLALGVTAYAYQQIGDDSGSGADLLRRFVKKDSLSARVYGAGPIINYATKMGDVPVTLEAKYITEFGARNRLESDSFWLSVGVTF
jgi:hypothetical protein